MWSYLMKILEWLKRHTRFFGLELARCSSRRRGSPPGANSLWIWWDQRKASKSSRESKRLILTAQDVLTCTSRDPLAHGSQAAGSQALLLTPGGTQWVGTWWLAGTWPIMYQEWKGGENGCFLTTPTLDRQSRDWPAALTPLKHPIDGHTGYLLRPGGTPGQRVPCSLQSILLGFLPRYLHTHDVLRWPLCKKARALQPHSTV